MPITYRPGWTYAGEAGRRADEVVADAADAVAEADGDGRAWLTLLIGSPPYNMVLPYREATVRIRRMVSV